MLLFAILAIGIQGFVVKPHIHLQAESALYTALTHGTGADTPAWDSEGERATALNVALKHGSHPLDSDQADCPMCQAAEQSGQYLTPSAAVFSLPVFVNVHTIEFSQRLAAQRAVSFAWQGRAPPKA